jgi:hypothetical protein
MVRITWVIQRTHLNRYTTRTKTAQRARISIRGNRLTLVSDLTIDDLNRAGIYPVLFIGVGDRVNSASIDCNIQAEGPWDIRIISGHITNGDIVGTTYLCAANGYASQCRCTQQQCCKHKTKFSHSYILSFFLLFSFGRVVISTPWFPKKSKLSHPQNFEFPHLLTQTLCDYKQYAHD